MQISAIDRQYVHITTSITLHDGTPASVSSLEGAIVRTGTTPGASQAWVTATALAGKWRLMLAGPYADSTGALVVPFVGGDLWVRVVDNPEILAKFAAHIDVV